MLQGSPAVILDVLLKAVAWDERPDLAELAQVPQHSIEQLYCIVAVSWQVALIVSVLILCIVNVSCQIALITQKVWSG